MYVNTWLKINHIFKKNPAELWVCGKEWPTWRSPWPPARRRPSCHSRGLACPRRCASGSRRDCHWDRWRKARYCKIKGLTKDYAEKTHSPPLTIYNLFGDKTQGENPIRRNNFRCLRRSHNRFLLPTTFVNPGFPREVQAFADNDCTCASFMQYKGVTNDSP